jgi:hypothetical protein
MFIGSLSQDIKSLLVDLVLGIIVLAFLFGGGINKVIDRAISGAIIIFIIFVLGGLLFQCSPSRDYYDDTYYEDVRR